MLRKIGGFSEMDRIIKAMEKQYLLPALELVEEGTRWWDKKVRLWENDIEYWLYEDHKKIEINGKDIPIKTLKQFYKYLVKYCVDKKNN